jgi:UDPglucose 6-dehydrogenase
VDIAVIGTGYVGLVTGAVFADLGNDVVCVDNDERKVEGLLQGVMPIFEPGLEEMVRRNFVDARLQFTTDLDAAVRRSEILFIAVPTPAGDDGRSDLSAVEGVARSVARAMNGYKVVVNKSTVPVGTGDLVRRIIQESKSWPGDFDVVSNPEFLREGMAIHDTLKPERIVIGAPSRSVAMKLLELYAPLGCPMLITDVASAEIIKYASNAFLATRISFINMIADLCEKTGADVVQVAKAMGCDSRIGPAFLNAGLGFGGSCFPKDLVSLIHTLRQSGVQPDLLEAVCDVNRERVPHLFQRIRQELGSLEGKVIGVLGLAFKPDTDDTREAKALELIEHLLKDGASVQAYDPQAMDKARERLPQVRYCENVYEAAAAADALVVVTEWNEFRFMNLERIRDLMREPVLFDARNIYSPDRQRKLGFRYFGVGRAALSA